MLNRVLSRPFFYSLKRGSQSKSDLKAKSEVSDTPGASPERVSDAQSESPVTRDAPQEETPRNTEPKHRPRSSTSGHRHVIFQPYHDPTQRSASKIVLEGLDQPAAETLTKQDTSGSFVLVNTSNPTIKPEEEEVDEEFQTPVLDTSDDVDGPLPSESSTTDYGVPFLPPAVSAAVASPSHSQESLAFGIESTQTGILSDISEAEEPSGCDVADSPMSGQSLAPTAENPKQELSFASFGSSYPSSSPSSGTTTSSCAVSPDQACDDLKPTSRAVDETPSSTSASQPRVLAVSSVIDISATPSSTSLVDAQVQTSDDVITAVSRTDAVVDALSLSSSLQTVSAASISLHAGSRQEHKATQVSDTERPVTVPPSSPISPTTTRLPNSPLSTPGLESVGADTEPSGRCSSAESTTPLAAVVVPVPEQVTNSGAALPQPTHRRTGSTHTADRPNWALAPSEASPSDSVTVSAPSQDEGGNPSRVSVVVATPMVHRRTGPPHTADRPNWALAPDEPTEPKSTRGRWSRGRGRGRGRSWARGSNAIPLGSRNRGQSRAPRPEASEANEASSSGTAHRMNEVAADVGSSLVNDGVFNAPPLVVRERSAGSDTQQNGPALWLQHIDSWLAEPAQGSESSPASEPATAGRFFTASPVTSLFLAASLTPDDRRRDLSETSRARRNSYASARQPTSGQPTQTPSPMSTSRGTPRASPYTDVDVERLRRMLRNSGLQDDIGNSSGGPGVRRQPSRNLDARGRQQPEFMGRDSVRVVYCAPGGSRSRVLQATNQFVPFQPSPEDFAQPRPRYPAPTPLATHESTPTSSVRRSFAERHRTDDSFTNSPTRSWDHTQSSPAYSLRGQRSVHSFSEARGEGHALPSRPQSFASPRTTTRRTRRLTAEPMRL